MFLLLVALYILKSPYVLYISVQLYVTLYRRLQRQIYLIYIWETSIKISRKLQFTAILTHNKVHFT
jgi:hypothetical protein